LYPVYHAKSEILAISPLRVDAAALSVHFWDPMKNRLALTAHRAPDGAVMPRAGGMFMIMAIITTTRMRGASG